MTPLPPTLLLSSYHPVCQRPLLPLSTFNVFKAGATLSIITTNVDDLQQVSNSSPLAVANLTNILASLPHKENLFSVQVTTIHAPCEGLCPSEEDEDYELDEDGNPIDDEGTRQKVNPSVTCDHMILDIDIDLQTITVKEFSEMVVSAVEDTTQHKQACKLCLQSTCPAVLLAFVTIKFLIDGRSLC